ncbi:MAG TPA: septal ring lytic transglycosylase RlpA family protein [Terriglobia bacterium]|nr:septal ring lytic transglycosylase RlpA family protein [Terriglobia bacterium]
MLRFFVGLGVTAFVAISPPSQASQPTCLPVCTRAAIHAGSKDGVATWYGDEFQGGLTASGEVYDKNGLTAAHPDLPLGTQIRVTNLKNRHSLILRVNDRGPYVRGRLLDVSRAAARRLGFLNSGKAWVRIEVLKIANHPQYHLVCPGARLFALN